MVRRAAVLVALGLAIIAYIWWGPGPLAKPTLFIVHDGATLSEVAGDLKRAHAIGGVRRFYYLGRLMGHGAPIQAGEFELPAHASPATILNLLQHGKPILRLVTVSEGMPAIMVEERLAANPFLTGAVPHIEEGSVLPDSYGFERNEPRAVIVGRMQSAMKRTIAKLWPKRSDYCPVSTPEQAIILASIVEKETGKASERPRIAGVYCHRLRIGMKLDADPTLIYPVTKGKPLGRRISAAEKNALTGYNTYRQPGLPVGPITNPGRDAIAAVLQPIPTEDLYFVADGTGGHVFAQTLQEQQANIAKWMQHTRNQGGR